MEHADLIFRGIHPYTLLDLARFRRIYRLLNQVVDLDGDIAELGVYKGGISAGMSLIAPQKTLHLFDSFEGLGDTEYEEIHQKGDFADTTVEGVKALFPATNQPQMHIGWFPATVTAELMSTSFSFVHVDGDYYETTRDALNFFYPRLTQGGIMVFDDWEWVNCPGVKRALEEGQIQYGFEIVAEYVQAYITKV